MKLRDEALRAAEATVKLDAIGQEAGGCVHVGDDADSKCWHCRIEERAVVIEQAAERVRKEAFAAGLLRANQIISSHKEHDPHAGHEHGPILGCGPAMMVEIGHEARGTK